MKACEEKGTNQGLVTTCTHNTFLPPIFSLYWRPFLLPTVKVKFISDYLTWVFMNGSA